MQVQGPRILVTIVDNASFLGGVFGCQGFQKYENWGECDYISSILIRLMTLQRAISES